MKILGTLQTGITVYLMHQLLVIDSEASVLVGHVSFLGLGADSTYILHIGDITHALRDCFEQLNKIKMVL